MNTNDFLTRLRAGETADAIAADLAAALNEAEATFKAEEAAAKEQEAAASKRNEALDAIIDAVNAYIADYEPDLVAAFFPDDREAARVILTDAFSKSRKVLKLFEGLITKEDSTDAVFDIDSLFGLFR